MFEARLYIYRGWLLSDKRRRRGWGKERGGEEEGEGAQKPHRCSLIRISL